MGKRHLEWSVSVKCRNQLKHINKHILQGCINIKNWKKLEEFLFLDSRMPQNPFFSLFFFFFNNINIMFT